MSLQEDQVDLMNSETIIQFVQSAGPLGPLAYILVQILQTIIAPIPGNLVGTVGGFLFGVWGILWTTIGSAIGVLIVFILAKKYGRRIILKLLRRKDLGKFDEVPEERAGLIFFLFFLIPGLPDDLISYAAGLSKVSIPKLMLLWIVGRMPAVVMTNFIGMGLEEGDYRKTIILIGVSGIIVVLVALKNKEIVSFVEKRFGKKRIEKRRKSKN